MDADEKALWDRVESEPDNHAAKLVLADYIQERRPNDAAVIGLRWMAAKGKFPDRESLMIGGKTNYCWRPDWWMPRVCALAWLLHGAVNVRGKHLAACVRVLGAELRKIRGVVNDS